MFNGLNMSDVSDYKFGSQQVSYVYYGSTLIWPKTPPGPTHDYSLDYFTIEAIEAGNLFFYSSSERNFTCTISYSTDNGQTWSQATSTTNNDGLIDRGTLVCSLNAGDKVLLKGNNERYTKYISSTYQENFFRYGTLMQLPLQCNVSGNIMSLVYGDNFVGQTSLTMSYTFRRLFNYNNIVSAQNLILPATTLTNNCYDGMFMDCALLTSIPTLPATTLAQSCYYNMYENCISLVNPPALPATTLANYCYWDMFKGCTSLTTAPSLPATQMYESCYQEMFRNCTSLTTAPSILPAQLLAGSSSTTERGCYWAMFKGCTSLTIAPELPSEQLTYSCYKEMFSDCTNLNYIKCAARLLIDSLDSTLNWTNNVSATGTFYKNPLAQQGTDNTGQKWPTGVNGIPADWTVIDIT